MRVKKDCKKILKWAHIKHVDRANVFLLYYEDGIDTVEFSEYSNKDGVLEFTIGDSSKERNSETFFEDTFHCVLRWEDNLVFNTVLEKNCD